MEKLGLNIIKYTIGFPMMIIVSIFRLFYILKLIAINSGFVVFRWRQLIRIWKPYINKNTR